MPKITKIFFSCDICDAPLPVGHLADKPPHECVVNFGFYVDGEWSMEVSTKYEMLCKPCKDGLIKVVKDFEKQRKKAS